MISTLVDDLVRLLIALVAVLVLVIPMFIMLVHLSPKKSLVPSSVFMVMFACVLSFAVKTSNVETPVTAATYLAVLVVFVRANSLAGWGRRHRMNSGYPFNDDLHGTKRAYCVAKDPSKNIPCKSRDCYFCHILRLSFGVAHDSESSLFGKNTSLDLILLGNGDMFGPEICTNSASSGP